jgi:hypothetical protein
MADNFEGIDWGRLKEFCKLLRSLKNKKSWVYIYGYCVAMIAEPYRTFWVCRVCYENKWSRDKPIHEIIFLISGAIKHLMLDRPGHRRNCKGGTVTIELAPG